MLTSVIERQKREGIPVWIHVHYSLGVLIGKRETLEVRRRVGLDLKGYELLMSKEKSS